MDLREIKTERSIKEAFLTLRAKKPLERITVKELAEQAQISKATFYLHYRDIYDLSAKMQGEVVREALESTDYPRLFLTEPIVFMKKLFQSCYTHKQVITILFSDNQLSALPAEVENTLKQHLYEALPSSRHNLQINMVLTYMIQGAHHAFMNNINQYDIEALLDAIGEYNVGVTSHLKQLVEEEIRKNGPIQGGPQ